MRWPTASYVLEGREDARLRVGQGLKDELHAHLVVGDGDVLHDFIAAGRRVLKNAGGKTDLLRDTLRDDVEDIVVFHVQKLVLDGRTSAIDDEDNHRL
jgi:hypothetical protein